jgi:hypothetical protein
MGPEALLALATVTAVLAAGVIVAIGTAAVVVRAEEQRKRRGLPELGTLEELGILTFVDAAVQGDFEMAEMAAGSAFEAGTQAPRT